MISDRVPEDFDNDARIMPLQDHGPLVEGRCGRGMSVIRATSYGEQRSWRLRNGIAANVLPGCNSGSLILICVDRLESYSSSVVTERLLLRTRSGILLWLSIL